MYKCGGTIWRVPNQLPNLVEGFRTCIAVAILRDEYPNERKLKNNSETEQIENREAKLNREKLFTVATHNLGIRLLYTRVFTERHDC